MSGETYVCVVLGENDEPVELPAEEDGTLLLSVVQSQFEGASGLKFRYDIILLIYIYNYSFPSPAGLKEAKVFYFLSLYLLIVFNFKIGEDLTN